MAVFAYKARTRAGEKVEGTVEAPDRRAALLQIERLGHVPVSVAERAGGEAPAPARRPWLRASRQEARMGARDLLLFTMELSDLLASGMKLGQALNSLANRQSGKTGDKVIVGLRDEIIRGANLSDAMRRYPRSFPALYVSMIRAGEAGGALSEVLGRLVTHFERVQETKEKVIMALVYPSIVMAMGVITVVFSMVFVVPQFQEVFLQMEAALPLPTRMLIGISDMTVRYGGIVAALLVVVGVVVFRTLKTPAGRWWRDRMLLRTPLLKGVVASGILSNFARTLETLMSNGVQALPALGIVQNTVNNEVIAREIRVARDRVTDGATISAPLAASSVFPRIMTDMLAVGEQTGDMCGALRHIARRYENELERNLKLFTTALEPILIVVVAVVVGFIAVSILMAVFSLSSGLGA